MVNKKQESLVYARKAFPATRARTIRLVDTQTESRDHSRQVITRLRTKEAKEIPKSPAIILDLADVPRENTPTESVFQNSGQPKSAQSVASPPGIEEPEGTTKSPFPGDQTPFQSFMVDNNEDIARSVDTKQQLEETTSGEVAKHTCQRWKSAEKANMEFTDRTLDSDVTTSNTEANSNAFEPAYSTDPPAAIPGYPIVSDPDSESDIKDEGASKSSGNYSTSGASSESVPRNTFFSSPSRDKSSLQEMSSSSTSGQKNQVWKNSSPDKIPQRRTRYFQPHTDIRPCPGNRPHCNGIAKHLPAKAHTREPRPRVWNVAPSVFRSLLKCTIL